MGSNVKCLKQLSFTSSQATLVKWPKVLMWVIKPPTSTFWIFITCHPHIWTTGWEMFLYRCLKSSCLLPLCHTNIYQFLIAGQLSVCSTLRALVQTHSDSNVGLNILSGVSFCEESPLTWLLHFDRFSPMWWTRTTAQLRRKEGSCCTLWSIKQFNLRWINFSHFF